MAILGKIFSGIESSSIASFPLISGKDPTRRYGCRPAAGDR